MDKIRLENDKGKPLLFNTISFLKTYIYVCVCVYLTDFGW